MQLERVSGTTGVLCVHPHTIPIPCKTNDRSFVGFNGFFHTAGHRVDDSEGAYWTVHPDETCTRLVTASDEAERARQTVKQNAVWLCTLHSHTVGASDNEEVGRAPTRAFANVRKPPYFGVTSVQFAHLRHNEGNQHPVTRTHAGSNPAQIFLECSKKWSM